MTAGMTAHESTATTTALKTALRSTKGQSWIHGPSATLRNIETGNTPTKVAMAIFHLGGG